MQKFKQKTMMFPGLQGWISGPGACEGLTIHLIGLERRLDYAAEL